MLKKLMKHEFKSISGMGILMLVVMFATTLIGWLSFKTPMWSAMFSESSVEYSFHISDVVGIFALIFYFILISVTSITFTIYVGVHFYRSMYTDRGYLTHTLPVTPVQILFSKVLTSGIWAFIINIAMFISMILVLFSFVGVILNGAGADWALFRVSLADMWSEMVVELQATEGFNVIGFIVLLVVFFVLAPFGSLITLFGALTLGQLSKSGRGVLGVVWYLLIVFVQAMISYIFSFASSLNAIEKYDIYSDAMMLQNYEQTYGITLILQVLTAIILWCVSVWILKKKINLH